MANQCFVTGEIALVIKKERQNNNKQTKKNTKKN